MKKSDQTKQTNRDWRIESEETVFEGFYKVEKIIFRHALFNGGESELIDREQFVRGNVVGVIAHDTKLDRIALVEQFRIGARNRADHPWLMEVIAGMVEPSEAPQDVAVREAYEEAGIRLDNVREVMTYLSSPGASAEEISIYYGETDLSTASGIFGLDEEGEDILLHVIDTNEAFAMLDDGRVCNGLSIIALQWFRHHRITNS